MVEIPAEPPPSLAAFGMTWGLVGCLALLACVPAPIPSPRRVPEPAAEDSATAAARVAERERAEAAAHAATDSAALAAIAPPPDWELDDRSPTVRIALATASHDPEISATGSWRLHDAETEALLVRALPGEAWQIRREGRRLFAARGDQLPSHPAARSLVARPAEPGGLLVFNGRRWRGEIRLVPTDSGVLVVNHLPLEQYLRGVVPLEIGDRTPAERQAVAAQAVAARSYAYMRLAAMRERSWDLVATVFDQVYGGADAEKPIADVAILETRGLVLRYAGRIVSTPYHSTCGGTTAEAPEVWRSAGEPHLQRVSDRIPGTDRHYCDISPRFRWTRTFTGSELSRVLERYLRSYVAVPAGRLGTIRDVETEGRTASGRTQALVVTTQRGRFRVRANDMRFVLRSPGGEILNSTYFSVTPTIERGMVSRLVVTGGGYGHGVGMCQWGAIGRARAGYDFRAILETYYPGTVVAPAD